MKLIGNSIGWGAGGVRGRKAKFLKVSMKLNWKFEEGGFETKILQQKGKDIFF